MINDRNERELADAKALIQRAFDSINGKDVKLISVNVTESMEAHESRSLTLTVQYFKL